jgi:hypothetical protein
MVLLLLLLWKVELYVITEVVFVSLIVLQKLSANFVYHADGNTVL